MDKKGQIYQYIKAEVLKNGLPPTIREIGKRFDISSTNGVRYFLEKLEDEGLIKRQSRRARGIKIIERFPHSDTISVPILGRVPAGRPTFSEENIEDTIQVDARIARGPGIFAVRVHGDSMVGAGINDGDIAVVKQNPLPASGEIVVALIDEEVTLKRILKKGTDVILRPENDKYPDLNLSELGHDRISIIGSVIAIIRRFY